jgi:hypothetical protein
MYNKRSEEYARLAAALRSFAATTDDRQVKAAAGSLANEAEHDARRWAKEEAPNL